MTIEGLRNIILRFENLNFRSVTGMRVQNDTANRGESCCYCHARFNRGDKQCSVHSWTINMPYTTVWKIMRKLLKCYPYTITRTSELLDRNAKVRLGLRSDVPSSFGSPCICDLGTSYGMIKRIFISQWYCE